MTTKSEIPENLVEDVFKESCENKEQLGVSNGQTEGHVRHVVRNAACGYQIIEERKEEIRNKRIQIVIKPSMNNKLDEYVKAGVIKSKNDLINYLLETFIEQQG